jgi:hypothetical protein
MPENRAGDAPLARFLGQGLSHSSRRAQARQRPCAVAGKVSSIDLGGLDALAAAKRLLERL